MNLSDDKMNIYSSKSCSKNYWGQMDTALLTYVKEKEEVISACLDDLDRDYEVPPSTIGLDYGLVSKRFCQSVSSF